MAVGLVLSGGAPVLTFMAGALVALDERDVKFDVISASGAGMLVGLLYAAPVGGADKRREALKNTDLHGRSGRDLRPLSGKLQSVPQARPARRCLPAMAQVVHSAPVRRSARPALRDRLVDARVRHAEPEQSRLGQPRAVRPCALGRRGCRFRAPEELRWRLLHQRLQSDRQRDGDLSQGTNHCRSLSRRSGVPVHLSAV